MKHIHFVLLILVVFLTGFALSGCPSGEEEAPLPIEEGETDPAVYGTYYPFEYETFLKTKEMESTRYGGSYPYSYLEEYPELKRIFGGKSYAVEYNRARGHYWAYKDMLETKRSPKMTTCMTCKTASAPRLMEEMGDDYYTTPLEETVDVDAEIESMEEGHAFSGEHKSISCSDCHEPKSMDLRITRPAFKEALKRRGRDVDEFSREELRTMTCGQCHVEYYFHPDEEKKNLILPWDEGFSPEDMEAYYSKRFRDMEKYQETGFFDYRHPEAQAPIILIQHPEYEMYQGGTHEAAGVSCVDCHMPRIEEEGTEKISHHITSPLKYIDQTCGNCHNQDQDWLKNRVHSVQKRTEEMKTRALDTLETALDALEKATEAENVDASRLKEARDLYASAHLRWHYVKAENSSGWHNQGKALQALGESIDRAHRAREAARDAIE